MPDTPANIHIFGEADPRSLKQLETSMGDHGEGLFGVLNADHHVGYSQPIGGGVAFPEHISVSGVGFDIGCLASGTPVGTSDGYTLPIEAVKAGHSASCWDTAQVRLIDPCLGAVARGTKPVVAVKFSDGRVVRATPDHRFYTRNGWRRADALTARDRVACSAFVGLPYEPVRGPLALPRLREATAPRGVSRGAELARRGLWPVRSEDVRLPALLRTLAYCIGDGNLSPDGKVVSLYTSVEDDVADLVADCRALGFPPTVYMRDRGIPGQQRQWIVRVNSVHLHALLEALGCPVGAKVRAWPADPLPWLHRLPKWARAVFLSAFMSAEGATPRFGADGVVPLAVKQAGSSRHAINFIARLFAGLEFRLAVTPSGSPRGDVQAYVGQLQGGAGETLRYLREVGFNRARRKREAAAAVLSAEVQRQAVRVLRREAIEVGRDLVTVGATVRSACAAVSATYDVPQSLVLHGLYGRGAPRRPKGWTADPDYSNEVAWLPVTSVTDDGEADVYDIATADPAESFMAAGVVVHNCGNKAALTNLTRDQIAGDVPRLMDEIVRRISFGVGRANAERVEHPVVERIGAADFHQTKGLRAKFTQRAASQLGTVGAGNHYVNLAVDERDRVWIGVHFGSRGFGHGVATGFVNLAHGRPFDAGELKMSPDAKPVLLPARSGLGQAYLEAMDLAGQYAYAGRDWVVERVLSILGARSLHEVHNHHNFAWRERHFGTDVWVVRKGCTPAFPGQQGFVGGSMGDDSVILEGVDSDLSRAGLRSTVHGAGRVMSRTQAAGKTRQRWACPRCDWVQPPRTHKPRACPSCHAARLARRMVLIAPGQVDWRSVRERLRGQGIELRGGAADEAPEVYKRLPEVLAAHEGTIRVLHTLTPIGVAMAGQDVVDPFKD